MKTPFAVIASLSVAALAACDTTPPPPLGQPIQLQQDWQWVDFPDAVCDDGSPTGVAISPSPTGKSDVMVFLNGGGACWDRTTCLVLNTASHGPFGQRQFTSVRSGVQNTILDRNLPGNPVADWNLVFVPYCTGDVHTGDAVADYGKPYYHKGHANILAYLKRLGATFPRPDRLIVAGSSAGGYGATFNYDSFRQYFPDAQATLIDDAGPAFIGNAIPTGLRASWYSAWNLSAALAQRCPECTDDLSLIYSRLSSTYKSDRLGLLSYTQDKTISGYLLKTGADFEADLYDLAHTRLDATPNMRYFFETGTTHTLLGHPTRETAQGVPLLTWLKQMISRDPAWRALTP